MRERERERERTRNKRSESKWMQYSKRQVRKKEAEEGREKQANHHTVQQLDKTEEKNTERTKETKNSRFDKRAKVHKQPLSLSHSWWKETIEKKVRRIRARKRRQQQQKENILQRFFFARKKNSKRNRGRKHHTEGESLGVMSYASHSNSLPYFYRAQSNHKMQMLHSNILHPLSHSFRRKKTLVSFLKIFFFLPFFSLRNRKCEQFYIFFFKSTKHFFSTSIFFLS